MCRITLRLHPADVLMFRKSRYFGTGAGASASEFPTPQTISGAIRRYMLSACGVGAEDVSKAKASSGKSLARFVEHLSDACRTICGASWAVDSRLIGPFLWAKEGLRHFPAPRTLVQIGDDGKLASLKPCDSAPPGWNVKHTPRPLAIGKNAKWDHLQEAYVNESQLENYLTNGHLSDSTRAYHLAAEQHFAQETRVGVGLSKETARAEEGLLYTSTFMRLKKDHALELDIVMPDSAAVAVLEAHIAAQPWLTLGGERKIARVEKTANAWAPPPAASATAGSKSLLYFATPALFKDGDCNPDTGEFGGVQPIAAAVGNPLAFSGWDLTRNRPLPTRYAVPAGAVYFFDGNVNTHDRCVSDDDNESLAGWGYVLRGEW